MSSQATPFVQTFTANADLSAKQFYLVKVDTSADATPANVVLAAGATAIIVGVLNNKPTSGQAAEVALAGIAPKARGPDAARANEMNRFAILLRENTGLSFQLYPNGNSVQACAQNSVTLECAHTSLLIRYQWKMIS